MSLLAAIAPAPMMDPQQGAQQQMHAHARIWRVEILPQRSRRDRFRCWQSTRRVRTTRLPKDTWANMVTDASAVAVVLCVLLFLLLLLQPLLMLLLKLLLLPLLLLLLLLLLQLLANHNNRKGGRC